MTDKERILAKIELLLDETNYEPYTDEVFGRIQSLRELKSYIDSLQEESVSEDLEEAVDSYTRKVLERTNCLIGNQPVGEEISKAVKFGAKWQKEQMMAKGVDGVVHHFEKCGVASVHYKDPTGVPMSYFISPKGLVAGDKVKVIAIKEEEL